MSVDLGPYGSGYRGDYTTYPVWLSPPTALQAALDSPNGVYLIGDSITVGHADQIAAYLTDTRKYPTGIRARSTAPMSDGIDWLIAAHHGGSGIPPTVVLAMGTNDIENPPVAWSQLDRLIADIGPERRLYVVSPFAARGGNTGPYFGYDIGNSARIAAREYALALSNPNVRVVDWHSRVFDNPLSNIRSWLVDGVHPNAAGINVWLSLIANAIDAYGVGTLPGGDTHG
jgi:lysophospholipase L1-like esterase